MVAAALFLKAADIVDQNRNSVQGESNLASNSEGGLTWEILEKTDKTKLGRPKTTAEHYLLGYLRMKKAGKTPLEMAGTTRSYYFYRASLIFVVRYQIKQVLREIANSRQPGNDVIDEGNYKELLRLVEALDQYPPDPNHKQRAKIQNTAPPPLGEWTRTQQKLKEEQQQNKLAPGPKKPLRQTNKKRGLSGLPQDWREQYWQKVKTSIYANAIAVLYCTGCRPGELRTGATVTLDKHQNLEFHIAGIKTHGGKFGQRLRIITESVQSPAAEHLKGLVRQAADQTLIIKADPKKLSDAMRWQSQALWPKQKYVVSPYSFRHQKSADVKAAFSQTEVAMVMGHRSCATQSFYAGGRLAKSANTVVGVQVSNEVRFHHKNSPFSAAQKHNMAEPMDESAPNEGFEPSLKMTT